MQFFLPPSSWQGVGTSGRKENHQVAGVLEIVSPSANVL